MKLKTSLESSKHVILIGAEKGILTSDVRQQRTETELEEKERDILCKSKFFQKHNP